MQLSKNHGKFQNICLSCRLTLNLIQLRFEFFLHTLHLPYFAESTWASPMLFEKPQAPSCLRSNLFTNFSTLILFKLNDMIVRFSKNPKLITNTNGLAVYSLSATMYVKVWYNWFAGWFIFGIEQMLQKFVI